MVFTVSFSASPNPLDSKHAPVCLLPAEYCLCLPFGACVLLLLCRVLCVPSLSAATLPLWVQSTQLYTLCRFPSSWRVKSIPLGPQSSPKMAPLDASPCRVSWGPSPPSPCTDTAQTPAVSGTAWRGCVAHPGLSTRLGPCPGGSAQEAVASEQRGTGRHGADHLAWVPSPLVPPRRGGVGPGSGWGSVALHCPGGISWSNCPEAAGPGP